MSLREKWFYVVLLSVFHGIVAVDEILMKPTSQHTLVVREGTDVTLTCYSGHGSNLMAVTWFRGSVLGKTVFNDEKNECNVTWGQIVEKGGHTHFECNRTSSTIVIQGVLQGDSKEWTCRSGKSHKSIKLEVQTVSSSTSTTTTIEPPSTTTTTQPPSTTTTTTQPPSTTLYSTETGDRGLSTSVYSPSSSEQRMTSVTQVNLTDREETDDTQWYIILPGALGGLAAVSLVIFLVWRNRTSRKRNLLRSIQKNRSDSEEHILEMQDNQAYWTSMQAAKSTSSQSEDAEEHEQIEMQDNPVYWKSSHAVKDHSTQLVDAEKEDNHVYWTSSLDTGDNSTQLADAEKEDNHVYWSSSLDTGDNSTQQADAEKEANHVYWTPNLDTGDNSTQLADAEKEDNHVYWTTSLDTGDNSTEQADAEKEDNHVYWTPNLDTGDNSTQLADGEKQIIPVYWTLEPECYGPSNTAGQRKEEC